MKNLIRITFFVLCFSLIDGTSFAEGNTLSTQPFSSDRAAAAEEFRRGVQSYFRGQFNEAVLLFEKALSYIPGEPLIMDWLGKSYFRSGIEGAALEQWEAAKDLGYGGILLKSKIETIKDRRSMNPAIFSDIKFSDQASIKGTVNKQEFFLQPTSICAMTDGTFWLVDYGANELLHFNVNGIITEKSNGPIQGFARPFDLIELPDGRLLLSEFSADKISILDKNGKYIKSFGKKGRGAGELIGPQYLAQDEFTNIYVSDFGNARIGVFSPEGEPLFEFGQKTSDFGGFIDPAGIAIFEGLVYVADGVHGAVFIFDTAGNYMGELLPKGSLKGMTSLKVWKNRLITADTNSAYTIDISTGAITKLVSLGNAPVRLLAATPDINDNILLVDYQNEKIEIASTIKELAGGLFVTVDRIFSENFPEVTIDIRVQNRNGYPVVGLNEKNFFITEKNRPVDNFEFYGSGHLSEECDITILIERSPESVADTELIDTACNEIISALKGKGKIKIVTASDNPVLEGVYTSLTKTTALKNPISYDWNFDLAARLSAAELLSAKPKRAVIFLNSGGDLSNGFNTYSLNDLTAFMNNNGIKFYTINLHKNQISPEIRYITKNTGGKMSYVYAEKGLTPIVEDIIETASGLYRMTYRSTMFTNFGRDFLPVEVEVRFLTRSGRDEIGYFAPLE
ncbi:MAG: hypothetical protein CR988_04570 [Treponema sp.]|nr:MAG: hypothetical protein CR988_04570 [Treponema sp.]